MTRVSTSTSILHGSHASCHAANTKAYLRKKGDYHSTSEHQATRGFANMFA